MGIGLACNYYLLGFVVEGDFLPGLDGSDVHAQRNGVRVAGADAGVWRLARAHTLHPIAHVGVGLWIAATAAGGVGVGRYLLHLVHQVEAGQLIRLHLHGGRFTRAETSGGRDGLLVHVDYAAVGDDRARVRQAGERVDGVDLVNQSLIGDAGGVGPEEAKLQVLARVEFVRDDAHAVALPVGIFCLEQRDDVGAAPAAGLVDVPTHLDHDDVAELTGVNEVAGGLVAGGGAPLGADSDDLVRAFERLGEGPRVVH